MELDKIKIKYEREIIEAVSLVELNDIRIKVLGKSGELTAILRNLKEYDPAIRPQIGKQVNELREHIESCLISKENEIFEQELDRKLKSEKIDITVSEERYVCGCLLPISVMQKRIIDFFVSLGFTVCDSPEIELIKYNFEKLNIPKNHPSREMQDTFYITDEIVLRTQTSAGQIRAMEKSKPPIRIINPGRVYRPDEADATHSPCFHQLEGLVIDKGITMCDLKSILESFAREFFAKKTKIRFRPSYFPFTEPSVEVDALCYSCNGQGCRVCKGTGWIEILGAGMVNRNVLNGCDINPDEFTGYAFGIGLDRITAIIHGINDARLPFEGDIRFLRQFK